LRVYRKSDKQLESFTHFTLLYSENIEGDLMHSDAKASYFWESDLSRASGDVFPSTPFLYDLYKKKRPFFTEKTFYI